MSSSQGEYQGSIKTLFYVASLICLFLVMTFFPIGLPEDFLGPQTLEVSAHRVQALKCGLHTQGTKQIFGAHLVKVEGDTSYVSPGPRLVVVLRSGHNCTLGDQRQQ